MGWISIVVFIMVILLFPSNSSGSTFVLIYSLLTAHTHTLTRGRGKDIKQIACKTVRVWNVFFVSVSYGSPKGKKFYPKSLPNNKRDLGSKRKKNIIFLLTFHIRTICRQTEDKSSLAERSTHTQFLGPKTTIKLWCDDDNGTLWWWQAGTTTTTPFLAPSVGGGKCVCVY